MKFALYRFNLTTHHSGAKVSSSFSSQLNVIHLQHFEIDYSIKSRILSLDLNSISPKFNNSMIHLWNKRLGHPTQKVVQQVLTFYTILHYFNKIPLICSSCQMEKAINSIFLNLAPNALHLFNYLLLMWGV